MGNWVAQFPAEFLLGFVTDILITINNEDARTARRFIPTKEQRHVHGVGVDLERFAVPSSEEKKALKDSLGMTGCQIIICVAELNENKNQPISSRPCPPSSPKCHTRGSYWSGAATVCRSCAPMRRKPESLIMFISRGIAQMSRI
ncbi:hypothetical protein GCM10027418_09190 [Mariniluteicoccus endophyticus]